MDNQKIRSIGWIGLGKMGLPICRRLAAAGLSITVYVRSDAAEEKARDEGFATSRTLAGLASADMMISAISDDHALGAIMNPDLLSALQPGRIFIDISTVSPTASAAAADKLSAAGQHYLRVPVSGSTVHAANGQLTAMASGPLAAFEAAKPVLAHFTARQFYLGEAEQSRYLKLAINSILAANSAVIAEALAIGEAGGLKRADMLEVMTQSAIATPLLGYKRDALVKGEYPPAFTVSQIMKDLDLVLGAARADHVPVAINAAVRQRFEQAYVDGNGEADFFCLCGKPRT